jgi:FAD/FMN-containing dehydrogenase
MDATVMGLVVRQLGDMARETLGAALESGVGAVLACETDAHTAADALKQLEVLAAVMEQHGGRRIGLTTDRAEALRIWRVRAELSPACHQLGEYKLNEDVAVPRHRMVEFNTALKEIGARHELTFLNYGHVGDGNFHITLMFDNADDPRLSAGRAAIGDACKLAVRLGGTITGEHGVGSAKAEHLPLMRDAVHRSLLKRIKDAFDPQGIMNPGKWL